MSFLNAWYFVTCLQRPKREQEIFLAILDGLSLSCGPELRKISVIQATKLDLPLRLYILPAIIRAIRDLELPEMLLESVIEDLCEGFPVDDDEVDLLPSLFTIAVNTGNGVSPLVERIAKRLIERHKIERESNPYEALVAHRAVSCVLTLLDLAADLDGSVLSCLTDSTEGGASISYACVRQLIDNSLKGECGRHAHLLALQVIARAEAGTSGRTQLGAALEILATNRFCRLEPDIMSGVIQAHFPLPPNPTELELEAIVKDISQELESFNLFSSLSVLMLERNQWLAALRAIGLLVERDKADATARGLWKAMLLERLATTATAMAAPKLHKHYLPKAWPDLWYTLISGGKGLQRYPQRSDTVANFLLMTHLTGLIAFAEADQDAKSPYRALFLLCADVFRVIDQGIKAKWGGGALSALMDGPQHILVSACQQRLQTIALCGSDNGINFESLTETAAYPPLFAERYELVFGDVLLSWCHDMMREGLTISNGDGVLKDRTSSVLRLLANRNDHAKEFTVSLLLRRQVLQKGLDDLSCEQVQEHLEQQLNENKKINSRMAMLSVRDLPARHWAEPTSFAGRIFSNSCNHPGDNNLLFLTTQTLRFLALCQEERPDPKLVKEWGSELNAVISAVNNHLAAERFLSLIWVDLLGKYPTAEVPGLWTALWSTICCYGGVLELVLLREQLAGDLRSKLRASGRIQALTNICVGSLSSLNAAENELHPPRRAINLQLRQRVLEDILLLSICSQQEGQDSGIAEWYKELADRTLEQAAREDASFAKGAVEAMHLGGREDWVMDIEGLSPWQISGASWNQHDSTIGLRVNVPSEPDFFNPCDDVERHKIAAAIDSGRPVTLAAPVLQSQNNEVRINVGDRKLWVATESDLPSGNFYRFSIRREQNSRWSVESGIRPRALKVDWAESCLVNLVIDETCNGGKFYREFTFRPKIDEYRFSSDWSFDYSLNLNRVPIGKYSTIAEWEFEGKHTNIYPVFRDFPYLVAELERSKHQWAVLAFGRLEDNVLNDEKDILVSLRPGQCFRFSIGRLSQRLRSSLLERLAVLSGLRIEGGAAGLLISVRLAFTGGCIELDGLYAPPDTLPIVAYPNLQFPLDDRNIRWRNAFSAINWGGNSDAEASPQSIFTAIGEKIDITPPIPGFPTVVNVERVDSKRTPRGGEYDFEVNEWYHGLTIHHYVSTDAHRYASDVPQVKAELVETMELAVSDLDRLTMMSTAKFGQIIEIKRVGNSIDGYGNILGYTPANWPVKISVDTLYPLGAPATKGDRFAKVIHVQLQNPIELVFDTSLPEPLSLEHSLSGILSMRPANLSLARRNKIEKGGEAPSQCRIHWRIGDGWSDWNVRVPDIWKYPMIGVGAEMRIEVDTSGVARLFARPKTVYTRVLWQLLEVENGLEKPHGTFVHGRNSYGYSLRGGVLEFGGTPPIQNVFKASRGRFVDRKDASSEVISAKGSIWGTVTGLTADRMEVNASLALRDISRHERSDKPLADIRVRLEVRPDRHAVKPAQMEWRNYIDEYFAKPAAPVAGKVIVREDAILFQLQGVRDAPILLVPPGEGPFLSFIRYGEMGKAILDQDDSGVVFASFRRVPPIDLDTLYREAFRAPTPGEFISLSDLALKMHYWKEKDSEDIYFEFGYGMRAKLSRDQLKYNWASDDSEELMLYVGDGISGVAFVPNEDYSEDTEGGDENVGSEDTPRSPVCALSVEAIEASDGRQIYVQTKLYNVVHLLTVRQTLDDFDILCVEGFQDRSPDISPPQRQWLVEPRSWASSRYLLDDHSVARLRHRRATMGDEVKTFHILGWLDTAQFDAEEGRFLLFGHRRMSFIESDDGPGLPRHCRVHMSVDRTDKTRFGNDVVAYMVAPDRLAHEDVGPDFDGGRFHPPVKMFRRAFSVREELLWRFHNEDDGEADCESLLIGKTLLVKVEPSEKGVSAILTGGDPPRDVRVLKTLVASRKSVLGYFLDRNGQGTLRIEIQPGVFFAISQWTGHTPKRKGELLRIEADPSNPNILTMESAAFSDERYVGEGGRAAVILPKDSLLRANKMAQARDPKLWSDKLFTVAGLPNLQARGVAPKGGRALTQEMIDFMCQGFPRVGVVFRVPAPASEVVISPMYEGGPIAARIFLSGNRLIAKSVVGGEEYQLAWDEFSFACVSLKQLKSHLQRTQWRYHDRQTGGWIMGKDGSIRADEPREIGALNCFSDRFFLHQGPGGRLTARYPKQLLNRFAFPCTEILSSLPRTQKGHVVPLVCTIASARTESVWLEVVPGRIIEMPASLLRPFGVQVSRFDWSLAKPGDQATISLIEAASPVEPDEFQMHWRPNARGLFMQGAALLPVVKSHDEDGALVIGAGAFTFTLPNEMPSQIPSPIIISPDNQMDDVGTLAEIPLGTSALMGCDQDTGRLFIHGLPECQVRAHRFSAPLGPDPLADEIWGQGDTGPMLLVRKAGDIIEALGGALPVTIEGTAPQYNVVYVSRRLQISEALPATGTVATAELLGAIPHSRDVALRCGSSLLRIPLVELVQGIGKQSHEDCFAIVAALRQRLGDRPLWIRHNEHGRMSTGLQPNADNEFEVSPLAVIGDLETDFFSGLICEAVFNRSLHWMQAAHVAWSHLTYGNANFFFSRPQRWSVARNAPGEEHVSRIRESDTQRLFKRLRVGSELSCRPMKICHSDDLVYVLATTVDKNMIVAIEMPDVESANALFQQSPAAVQSVTVSKRVVGRKNLLNCCLSSQRKYQVNLPDWFFGKPLREALVRNCSLRAPVPGAGIESGIDPDVYSSAWSIEGILAEIHASYANLEQDLTDGCRAARALADRLTSMDWVPLSPLLKGYMLLTMAAANPSKAANWTFPPTSQGRQTVVAIWQGRAVTLAREAHRRALNSLHIEVIVKALENPEKSLTASGLAGRFYKLLREFENSPNAKISQDLYSEITAIRKAAVINRLEAGHDEFSYVNAISSVIGEVVDIKALIDAAPIMMEVVSLFRTQASFGDILDDDEYLIKIASVILKIDSSPFDFPLSTGIPLSGSWVDPAVFDL